MDAEDSQGWEEQLTFYGLESGLRDEGNITAIMDELHLGDFPAFLFCRLGGSSFRQSSSATLYPESECRDGKAACDQHCSGEVVAYADETVRVEQDVEEETLVEVFEEVVDRADQAFGYSAEAHLIMPAVTHSLERDRINVVWHEGRVWACCMAERLSR